MSSPVACDNCRNCGAPAPGKFCPECGQETATEPRSAAQFFQALFRHYATRKGLLWQTLSRLFFAPGELTVEYLAGRRARYVRPLQLYLAASVIVFAAVQLFGLDAGLRFYGEHGIHVLRGSPLSGDESAGHGARLTPVQIVVDHIDTSAIRRFKAMSAEERFRFLHAKRAQAVSYFVLLLVPLFALILSLCYREPRRRYGAHLVFGLYTHSFLLFMLLVEAMLPAILANIASLWVVAYFIMALRRVYGGTWARATGRGALVMTLYFGVAFAANLLLIFGLLEL
jgi:uncharacterized protein DUF3667